MNLLLFLVLLVFVFNAIEVRVHRKVCAALLVALVVTVAFMAIVPLLDHGLSYQIEVSAPGPPPR